MATPYNPIGGLQVNPRAFIKEKVNSAKNELKGLPAKKTTSGVAKPAGMSVKPQVTPQPKVMPEISTPGFANVSAQLPQVTKQQVEESKAMGQPTTERKEVADPFANTDLNPADYLAEIDDSGSLDGRTETADPFATSPAMMEDTPIVEEKNKVSPLGTIKDIGKEWRKEVKNVREEQKSDSAAMNRGEIGKDSHLVQTIGNVSNALVGAPVKAVMNSFINKVIPEETKAKGGDAIADFMQNTSAGQSISATLEQVDQLAQKYPEAADNIQAIVDTALNLFGGKVGEKVVREGVEQAGKTIIKEGEEQIVKGIQKQVTKAATKKADKIDDAIWEAVQPKYTAKATKDSAGKGTRKGLLQKRVVERTDADQPIIDVAKEAGIIDANDMDVNFNLAENKIAELATDLESRAASNTAKYNRNNMKNVVLDLEPSEGLTTDGEAMFQKVKNSLLKKLDAEENTTLGALKAVKKRRKTIRDEYPTFFETEKRGPLQKDVAKLNSATNDWIDTLLEGGAKDSFKKQSILFDLADTFKSKIEKPGTTILDRSPAAKKGLDIAKKALPYVVGGGVIGGGLKILGD